MFAVHILCDMMPLVKNRLSLGMQPNRECVLAYAKNNFDQA